MDIFFHVVVVSDTVSRDHSKDVSGKKAVELIKSRGYSVVKVDIVPNSYRDIVRVVMESPREANVIVFLGGTGPSPRDITVDVVESMAWRRLQGFGELFRRLSYELEGARAILSRAELYILSTGKIASVLPGSPRAIEIGVKILLDIVEHLVEEVHRFEEPHRDTHR
ncbi:MAG: molybdopterin-binding protein [Ignisphaera sp.]|uniref:MogA/MoaB family molybdenum cofactor biosynthesis protein n=1 Tax=Ignisphaera aggregans TaxID=334771 RepID=A0A7J3MYC2_9CREN